MTKYNHIFFDLDHTLWDFKTNSRLTLKEIHTHFSLEERGEISTDQFIEVYEKYNYKMWADYRNGKMSKKTLRTERFRQSLYRLGIKDLDLSFEIADFYVENSPVKRALFPGTIDVLTELKEKYILHIITNGFEEIQDIKMTQSGLAPFFKEIITSEKAGARKPHPAIFNYSLQMANASANECLMIGDNQLVDIEGAQKIGMDGVFFNPEREKTTVKPKYEVNHLKELLEFL